MEFEMALNSWIEHLNCGGSKTGKPLAVATEEAYRHMVSSFYAAPGDPRHPKAAIGARWMENEREALLTWRKSSPAGPVHKNKMTRYLRQFWDFCGDEDGLGLAFFEKNPSRGIRIQTSAEPARHQKVREDEQIKALQWFRNRFKTHASFSTFRDLVAVGLLFHSGLRPVEVFEHVRRSCIADGGDLILIHDAKTGEPKTALVPPKGTPERGEWDEYVQRHKSQFEDDDTLLFPADLSGRAFSRSSLQKNVVRSMRKELGLRPDWGLYAFRHSKATTLARKGASELEIAHLLGHKNVQTTRKYVHLNGVDMLKINDRYNGNGEQAEKREKPGRKKSAFRF